MIPSDSTFIESDIRPVSMNGSDRKNTEITQCIIEWERQTVSETMQLKGCWSTQQIDSYVLSNNIDQTMLLQVFQMLPPTISFCEKKDLMERMQGSLR